MEKKYIGAEHLKELLNNKHKEFTEKSKNNCFMQYQFMADGLNIAEQMVDSLQQEQQNNDLDADIGMEWDSFNKHIATYSEGTEEVVWLNWLSFVDIARYFYELGLKAGKEE